MRGMKFTVLGAAAIIGGALVYMSGSMQRDIGSGQEMTGTALLVLGLFLGVRDWPEGIGVSGVAEGSGTMG